jgi:hypothetical protein
MSAAILTYTDAATEAAEANAGLGCFVGGCVVARGLPPPRNDGQASAHPNFRSTSMN